MKSTVCLLLLLFSGVKATLGVTPYFVEEDVSLSIECKVPAADRNEVYWTIGDLKNNEVIVLLGTSFLPDGDIEVSDEVSQGVYTQRLRIQSMKQDRANVYSCRLGKQIVETFAILMKSDAIDQSSSSVPLYHGIEGKKLVLQCIVPDGESGNVIWLVGPDESQVVIALNDDITSINTTFEVTINGASHLLTIPEMSRDYVNTYTCRTEAKILFTAKVTLLACPEDLPTVEVDRKFEFIRKQTNANLKCHVTNNPGHNVIWVRRSSSSNAGDDILTEGQTVLIHQEKNKYEVRVNRRSDLSATATYTLVIADVTIDDEGMYVCAVQVLGLPFQDYPSNTIFVNVLTPAPNGKLYPVIHAASNKGKYKLKSNREAEAVCRERGMHLASLAEGAAALNMGLDQCICGWFATYWAGMPIRTPRKDPECFNAATKRTIVKCQDTWGTGGWDAYCGYTDDYAINKLPVTMEYGKLGRYSIAKLKDARKVCREHGTTIATAEDVYKAMKMGAHICECGYVEDGRVLLPLQFNDVSCWLAESASPRVVTCPPVKYWYLGYNVYCKRK